MSDTFLETKRDKKLIKHSAFVSKITTTHPSSRISKAARKNAKRHAARSKLQTNLESLADALPELTSEEVSQGRAERDGRVRHKSLKSKPGALRKKERVVRGEMERFGLSLAQLSTVTEPAAATVPAVTTTTTTETETTMEGVVGEEAPQQAPSAAANRFAALRGFISATMEQNPAFAGNKSTSKGS